MGKDLYVGNIPFDATEEDLFKLFSVAGTVRSVNLVTDPRTGQFKGSGFVRMSTEKEAKEAAVILDDALLINRQISVSVARTPEEKGAGPGGGRGKQGRQRASRGGKR